MSKWIGYLPDFYAASPQIAALQGALEQQTEALWTAKNGLIDQLDVNKATWGLSCWEASLGLDVDVSRPDAYRRTRILSKLRGQGTTTVAMIQNVAESFYNGQVAVEEQPEAYRFDIRFLSSIGVPPCRRPWRRSSPRTWHTTTSSSTGLGESWRRRPGESWRAGPGMRF